MKSKISRPNTKWLALDKFHQIPLWDLSPEAIKESVKSCRRDREKIKHNTLLNAVVRSLGFPGGFSGYKKQYVSELIPFMKEHGLSAHTDLFARRKINEYHLIPSISAQSLADRFFLSGKPLPLQVFTGHNFDFVSTLDDGHASRHMFQLHQNHPKKIVLKSIIGSHDIETLRSDLALADSNPSLKIEGSNFSRSLKDYIIGGETFNIKHGTNLLGDVCVLPRLCDPVVKLYSPSSCSGERDSSTHEGDTIREHIEYSKFVVSIFQDRISESRLGWLDVLPFNDRLIFLRGENGEYDFVFDGLKDYYFDHAFHCNLYYKDLKIAEIPSFEKTYHFKRWLHFSYIGWLENDYHEAEKMFWASGKDDYPSLDVVLDEYLEIKAKKIYSLGKKATDLTRHESELLKYYFPKHNSQRFESKLIDGFVKLELDGRSIAVSNPISIDVFKVFCDQNKDYIKSKSSNEISIYNSDLDTSLPCAVNWYDVLAFIKWVEDVEKIKYRLLSVDEYLSLRTKISKEYPSLKGIRSELKASSLFGVHSCLPTFAKEPWPGFSEENLLVPRDLIWTDSNDVKHSAMPWGAIKKCVFNPKIKSTELKNGLIFYNSDSFSEWLLEGTCVRSESLTGYCGDLGLLWAKPPHDTTSYKDRKTGFRLCYDLPN